MLHFLLRCRRRLDALGFDKKGAIYQAIDKAHCAMHDLFVTLHYESCGRGVGRPGEDRPGFTRPADQAQRPPNHPTALSRLPTGVKSDHWAADWRLMSSTSYRPGSLERIAGWIASIWSTLTTIGSCPLRLMRCMGLIVQSGMPWPDRTADRRGWRDYGRAATFASCSTSARPSTFDPPGSVAGQRSV